MEEEEAPKPHRLRQFNDEIVKRVKSAKPKKKRKKRPIRKTRRPKLVAELKEEKICQTYYKKKINTTRRFASTMVDALTGFPIVNMYIKHITIKFELFYLLCIIYHYLSFELNDGVHYEMSRQVTLRRADRLIALGLVEKFKFVRNTTTYNRYSLTVKGEDMVHAFTKFYNKHVKELYKQITAKKRAKSKVTGKLLKTREETLGRSRYFQEKLRQELNELKKTRLNNPT